MMGRRIHSTADPSPFGKLRLGLLVLTLLAITAFAQLPRPSADGDVAMRGSEAPVLLNDMQQDSVEVTLVPYEIDIPETLMAGMTIFKITNEGTGDLGFAIKGEGIEEELSPIPAGETQSLTVDLAPGSYTVYCPVGDLRERGMETTVTVENAGIE